MLLQGYRKTWQREKAAVVAGAGVSNSVPAVGRGYVNRDLIATWLLCCLIQLVHRDPQVNTRKGWMASLLPPKAWYHPTSQKPPVNAELALPVAFLIELSPPKKHSPGLDTDGLQKYVTGGSASGQELSSLPTPGCWKRAPWGYCLKENQRKIQGQIT